MIEDLRALASETGMAVVSLEGVVPTALAIRLVPEWLARRHLIAPVAVEGRLLTYATYRRFDAEVDTDVAYTAGRRTSAVLATHAEILTAIDRCYPERRSYMPPDIAATPDAHGRRRVLVTDDEPTSRMLVRRLLEREGFEVSEAVSGADGVARAMAILPNVVLMDLNMPGIDGYEAIRRLRRQPALAALAILVLTAEEGHDVERRVMALGADDYAAKPFHPGDLIARVRGALHRTAVLAA